MTARMLSTDALRRAFHPAAQVAERDALYITPRDAERIAAGAAGMALRGTNYSPQDRADCAADILATILADARIGRGQSRAGTGTPRAVLAYIARAERSPLTAAAADLIPADLATFTRCYGLARNWRRALTIRRKYDTADAERRAAADLAGGASVVDNTETVTGTPHAARVAALDALANLGVTDYGTGHGPRRLDARRAEPMRPAHGRPGAVLAYLADVEAIRDRATAWPVRWGVALRDRPVIRRRQVTPPSASAWTVAYAAARGADGTPPADLAAELDARPGTVRERERAARVALAVRPPTPSTPAPILGRGADGKSRVTRTPDRPDWADALAVPAGGVAYGVTAGRLERADRTAPDAPAPVTVTRDPSIIRDRADGPSDWAQELRTGTPAQRRAADRLAHAAAIRDGKADR